MYVVFVLWRKWCFGNGVNYECCVVIRERVDMGGVVKNFFCWCSM